MKRFLAIIMLLTFLTVGCAENKQTNLYQVDVSKPYVIVNLNFDTSSYSGSLFGKYYPSYSIWLEDEENGQVKTIYATGKAASKDWNNGNKRPSALPVWFGVLKNEFTDETVKTAQLDAVSSATVSKENTELLFQIPKQYISRKVNIYLEANISFDYNDYYKKGLKEGEEGYSDVNGQPSVIWKASVDMANMPDNTITPTIAGCGDLLGKDHKIHSDISKITTAKQMISKVQYKFMGFEKK